MFVTSLPKNVQLLRKCQMQTCFWNFCRTHSDFQISTTSLFSFPTVPLKLAYYPFHGLPLEAYILVDSNRLLADRRKKLFCVVLRAFFRTCAFYVLNCSRKLLAVLGSFQLHKRFLSDLGPNRNKLLLFRLDRCLSG